MRKYLIITNWIIASILAIGALPSLAHAQAYEAELRVVAESIVVKLEQSNQRAGTVLDFTDLRGGHTELGRFLAQELSDQMVRASKRLALVDRTNLQHLLRENKLTVEGLIDPATTKKLGQLIGIDTVIYGSTAPIGEKIRLSVRAVSVETGKIVATHSATIAAIDGLGEMHSRGVAQVPSSGPVSQSIDSRARFRADTIAIAGKDVLVLVSPYGPSDSAAKATFDLENRSGIGIDVAIRQIAIGTCSHDSWGPNVSGLNYLSPNSVAEKRFMSFLPAGSKIRITAALNCKTKEFDGLRTTNLSVQLTVLSQDGKLELPLSAFDVPIRVARSN